MSLLRTLLGSLASPPPTTPPRPIATVTRLRLLWALLALGSGAVVAAAAGDPAITLRLFAGGPSQRPDVLRRLLDEYETAHPGVRVEIETGGATSELQRKYLGSLLNAKDETFDALFLDIVAPQQFAAAGWIEPLDGLVDGGIDPLVADFLPVYRTVNRHRGAWVALPWVTDALFLYYRSDLLAKYGQRVPATWGELADTALRIRAAEGTGLATGLSIQGAPIEGAVCTFLLPYWSRGAEFLNEGGGLALDREAALGSYRTWLDLLDRGVLPKSTAETKTADTMNEFLAGRALFALSWGFAREAFENAPDSAVKGRVGIARVPSVEGGAQVTALGGYQWAVSAFSRHKREAAALIVHLTSVEVARRYTLETGFLPSREFAYHDPLILGKLPWVEFALPVILSGKSRPVTPRYSEVSETLRTATSSVLARALAPDKAVDDIERRLRRVLR